MTELVVICVVRNWKERGRLERSRIGIILGFEGLGVIIRYFALNVLGKSFIREWLIGRGKSGGSIWGGGISNTYLDFLTLFLTKNPITTPTINTAMPLNT